VKAIIEPSAKKRIDFNADVIVSRRASPPVVHNPTIAAVAERNLRLLTVVSAEARIGCWTVPPAPTR